MILTFKTTDKRYNKKDIINIKENYQGKTVRKKPYS